MFASAFLNKIGRCFVLFDISR